MGVFSKNSFAAFFPVSYTLSIKFHTFCPSFGKKNIFEPIGGLFLLSKKSEIITKKTFRPRWLWRIFLFRNQKNMVCKTARISVPASS